MNDKPSESDQRELLQTWSDSLLGELGLHDVDVDIDAVLGLAGVIAHAIVRPAAPLTAFLVGYAAGRSVQTEHLTDAAAFAVAAETARELAASGNYSPSA